MEGLQGPLTNRLTSFGPGTSTDPDGDWSGLHLNWICGSTNRTVEVQDNWIEEFDFAGLDFEQVVDVQVACNAVASSRRGLSISRDSEAYGPGVRFWQNSFLQNVDGDVASVVTDASYKVKMGPDWC